MKFEKNTPVTVNRGPHRPVTRTWTDTDVRAFVNSYAPDVTVGDVLESFEEGINYICGHYKDDSEEVQAMHVAYGLG